MIRYAVCLLLALSLPLQAQQTSRGCRLIVDAATGTVLLKEGPCEVRQSPCSTFKVPLALMGFDSGILKDEHLPAWDYLPKYQSNRPEEQKSVDPTSWEALSVVWYSQKLTQQLGLSAFQKYVDQFDYGNKNLSGNPGKGDGLTQAWLNSSLEISPEEQVRFIQKLLQQKLGVKKEAYALVEKILPRFPAEKSWILTGKTGSGFQKNADGTFNRKMHLGWFVGWADQGNRRVIFAELLVDDTPNDTYGGLRARSALIEALPKIMEKR